MNAPFLYDYQNIADSEQSPNLVHVSNTGLNRFFEKYLMQKAISLFKWTIPEFWDRDYFLYSLYCLGRVAVFNSGKYGVIPQHCTLSGRNVFYRPTKAVVSNMLLPELRPMTIGEECALIKLNPDYSGIYDLVSYYANLLALLAEAAGVNAVNTKLAYIFPAKNRAAAESFKKMYDKIASGEPAVFVDKSLYDEDGSLNWQPFTSQLSSLFIVPEIIDAMRAVEDRFDTEIGIPNANVKKKERMIQDEVNSNNSETKCNAELWLINVRKGLKQCKELFGIDIAVDWRDDLKEVISNGKTSESISTRTV